MYNATSHVKDMYINMQVPFICLKDWPIREHLFKCGCLSIPNNPSITLDDLSMQNIFYSIAQDDLRCTHYIVKNNSASD